MIDDLHDRLVSSDPLTTEPLPPSPDLQRMRRTILAEATRATSPPASWRQPAWIAAAIALVAIVAGVLLPVRAPGGAPPPSFDDDGVAARASLDAAPRRQLQFVTAGGTRIIWILNEELDEWNDR
mgnify:CR=1 FL=1